MRVIYTGPLDIPGGEHFVMRSLPGGQLVLLGGHVVDEDDCWYV